MIAHCREVAKACLPIVACNNPYDTKADLADKPHRGAYWHGARATAVPVRRVRGG
jgi:hypothetical protein